MREWIPAGIILGLRMETSEKNLVSALAREAGIKEIYESYINLNNQLACVCLCEEVCVRAMSYKV